MSHARKIWTIVNIEYPSFLTLTKIFISIVSDLSLNCIDRSHINLHRINHRAVAGDCRHSISGRLVREDSDQGGRVSRAPCVNHILIVEAIEICVQNHRSTSANNRLVGRYMQVAAEGVHFDSGSSGTHLLTTYNISSGHGISTRCCDRINSKLFTIAPSIFMVIYNI